MLGLYHVLSKKLVHTLTATTSLVTRLRARITYPKDPSVINKQHIPRSVNGVQYVEGAAVCRGVERCASAPTETSASRVCRFRGVQEEV